MILSGYNDKVGILTINSLNRIKYKNIRIEISEDIIRFYCFNKYKVFYYFDYYRYDIEKDFDLYRALIAFDEKITSDIIDPFCLSKYSQSLLIDISNTVNELILNMSK